MHYFSISPENARPVTTNTCFFFQHIKFGFKGNETIIHACSVISHYIKVNHEKVVHM